MRAPVDKRGRKVRSFQLSLGTAECTHVIKTLSTIADGLGVPLRTVLWETLSRQGIRLGVQVRNVRKNEDMARYYRMKDKVNLVLCCIPTIVRLTGVCLLLRFFNFKRSLPVQPACANLLCVVAGGCRGARSAAAACQRDTGCASSRAYGIHGRAWHSASRVGWRKAEGAGTCRRHRGSCCREERWRRQAHARGPEAKEAGAGRQRCGCTASRGRDRRLGTRARAGAPEAGEAGGGTGRGGACACRRSGACFARSCSERRREGAAGREGRSDAARAGLGSGR